MAELLSLAYGPAIVLPNYLAPVPGIEKAYIYGSWAARHAGEAGHTPVDIDLLIVGNPPRTEAYEAVRLAGSAIGRDVNARIVSVDQWGSAHSDPFLSTLTQRPLTRLDLTEKKS
ncbi:MAG: nucleotidyltransferase domain-containing protein [Cryobacterium sp.]|nr:nucleotidyltransferase domain-containing protein [Cryobacterium sp.]